MYLVSHLSLISAYPEGFGNPITFIYINLTFRTETFHFSEIPNKYLFKSMSQWIFCLLIIILSYSQHEWDISNLGKSIFFCRRTCHVGSACGLFFNYLFLEINSFADLTWACITLILLLKQEGKWVSLNIFINIYWVAFWPHKIPPSKTRRDLESA